jgi:hypothetical protein
MLCSERGFWFLYGPWFITDFEEMLFSSSTETRETTTIYFKIFQVFFILKYIKIFFFEFFKIIFGICT